MQCPNPKKGGIKCTRARAMCQASCGLCSSDECGDAAIAEKENSVANLISQLAECGVTDDGGEGSSYGAYGDTGY